MNAVEIYTHDYSPFADKKYRILAVQREIEVTLITPKGRPFELMGIVDLVVKDDQDRIWLWDNKTIGKPPFWSEDQLLMDSQMATYNAVLRTLGKDIFGTIVNQLNLHPYKQKLDMTPNKLFHRGEIYHSQRELDSHVANIGLMVDDMLDKIDSMVYPLSRRRDCDSCNFAMPCLMNMKMGEEVMRDILDSEYHKRKTQFNVDS